MKLWRAKAIVRLSYSHPRRFAAHKYILRITEGLRLRKSRVSRGIRVWDDVSKLQEETPEKKCIRLRAATPRVPEHSPRRQGPRHKPARPQGRQLWKILIFISEAHKILSLKVMKWDCPDCWRRRRLAGMEAIYNIRGPECSDPQVSAQKRGANPGHPAAQDRQDHSVLGNDRDVAGTAVSKLSPPPVNYSWNENKPLEVSQHKERNPH